MIKEKVYGLGVGDVGNEKPCSYVSIRGVQNWRDNSTLPYNRTRLHNEFEIIWNQCGHMIWFWTNQKCLTQNQHDDSNEHLWYQYFLF